MTTKENTTNTLLLVLILVIAGPLVLGTLAVGGCTIISGIIVTNAADRVIKEKEKMEREEAEKLTQGGK